MAAYSAHDMAALPPSAPKDRPRSNPHVDRLNSLAQSLAANAGKPAVSRVVIEGVVRALDLCLISSAAFLLHALHVAPLLRHDVTQLVAVPLVAAVSVLVFQSFGLYRFASFRHFPMEGVRLGLAWTLVFLGALAALFLFHLNGSFSRIWFLGWYVAGFGLLMLERAILAVLTAHLVRTGRTQRRTVVVGGGPAADALFKDLTAQPQEELHICGFFDDRADDRSPDHIGTYTKLGSVDDLVEFARQTRLDLVIFALPITAEQRLLEMLRKLWVLPVDIRLAAHSNKLRFRPRAYSYIGSVPVIDVFDKPIADWDIVTKFLFDRIVGALCLVLLSPVLLAVAIAVKLDSPGPVLFRQRRYGFNNELIEVFKFRSMYADKTDHLALNQVKKVDPRVTRVGRFIRKTSLDELPQLFNVVLKGNLSLVGPRPHAIYTLAANKQYEEVVDGYFARHRVKPGITGWAQINGWRGETDTPEKIQRRVECDLYYIENWSLFLDIYIMFATPFALLKMENAY